MGTPLGPKYIPYTYMDPLGDMVVFGLEFSDCRRVMVILFGFLCILVVPIFTGGKSFFKIMWKRRKRLQ